MSALVAETCPLSRAAPREAVAPSGRGSLAGFVSQADDGLCEISLLVEGVHCGACVRRIEDAMAGLPAMHQARLNLSTRRLLLRWQGAPERVDALVADIAALGYRAVPYQAAGLQERDRDAERALLQALAVAFFAAANVMMLSWAVWAGDASSMGPATRSFFHWLSLLVALPAVAYAGMPFYRSAAEVLRQGHTNMDVPISVGVLLATLMSVIETVRGGPDAYFDGALGLLFVLLVGRYLDLRIRGQARSAVQQLAALCDQPVQVLQADGSLLATPVEAVPQGARVLVAAGERIGVDGLIETGASAVETALIDGESTPRPVATGERVLAGMINLAQSLTIRVSAAGQSTVLADIVRLLEAAEQKKGRYVSIANRVVGWYTPVIHVLALLTFAGWYWIGDLAWQPALVNAVCVLIIACPCALGLAVPVTQVVVAGRLMRVGVLLKSDTALERLAGIDTVIFDKTGTLTTLLPSLVAVPDEPAAVALASGMAAGSRHPLAAALRRQFPDVPALDCVSEQPGEGLCWSGPTGEVRLGSALFCGVPVDDLSADDEPVSDDVAGPDLVGSEVWLARPGAAPVRFGFAAALRPDAVQTIATMQARGYRPIILSGDRLPVVSQVAQRLGVSDWQAGLTPQDKIAIVERLQAEGHRVLMVGDGLNDTLALTAADASLAPAEAMDISRRAADVVWQGRYLTPVLSLLRLARRGQRVVVQNIGFSFLYNIALVPVAMAGLVTPWLAALAMASSSILVTLNALSLRLGSLGDIAAAGGGNSGFGEDK